MVDGSEFLVLDSFAGSGTTAHSVLEQNKKDGGNRKFILVEIDDEVARKVTSQRIKKYSSGFSTKNNDVIIGFGNGFQYCKLSADPLFDANGQIRSDVTFSQLAEFVWFVETGTGFTGKADSTLLGINEGRAVYLLYNGILRDRSVDGGNVLTSPVFLDLPGHNGPKVIYAAACRLGTKRLNQLNIVFKQTPYALDV